jgi:acyl dehydratase
VPGSSTISSPARTSGRPSSLIRPIRAGDTVTVTGKVSDIKPEANGSRVMVELTVQNANGETTAVGVGSAIVPAGLLPPAD